MCVVCVPATDIAGPPARYLEVLVSFDRLFGQPGVLVMINYFGIEKRQAGSAGVVLLVAAAMLLLSTESKADSGL